MNLFYQCFIFCLIFYLYVLFMFMFMFMSNFNTFFFEPLFFFFLFLDSITSYFLFLSFLSFIRWFILYNLWILRFQIWLFDNFKTNFSIYKILQELCYKCLLISTFIKFYVYFVLKQFIFLCSEKSILFFFLKFSYDHFRSFCTRNFHFFFCL